MQQIESESSQKASPPKRVWRSIIFNGDAGTIEVKADRIAVAYRASRGTTLFGMSIVVESMKGKAVRAYLNGALKCSVSVESDYDHPLKRKVSRRDWRGNTTETEEEWTGGYVNLAPEGYENKNHAIGFGMYHSLFLARVPGFMPVATQDALWNELKDTRFTTPMLPEWIGHIEAKLLEDKRLVRCYSLGDINAALLEAETGHLDQIVEKGVQEGHLVIPHRDAVDVEFSVAPMVALPD